MFPDGLWKSYSTFDLRERVMLKGLVEVMDYGSRALAAAAFLLLPYLCAKPRWGWGDVGLTLWCVADVVFCLWIHIRASKAHYARYTPELDAGGRVALARTVFAQLDDPMSLLNWTEESSATSLELILTRGFLGKAKHELGEDELQQAEEIFAIFHTSDSNLTHAPCPREKVMLPSIHPILYSTRSILFYAAAAAVRLSGSIEYLKMGFGWHDLPSGLGYWLYRPGYEPRLPPILYFHGIGFGPTQMLPQIRALHAKYHYRTIIVLSLPQISLSPFSPVATESEILHAVDLVFQHNRLTKVSLVGHSFGTFLSMWLAVARPAYLAQLTLIDPVCFMTWNACLIKRACHAEPTTAVHHYVRSIIARDLGFSLATARSMYWPFTFQVCDAFPCPTNIYLAKRDWAIDAPATFHYLHNRKAKLQQDNVHIHMNDIDHLQFMFTPDLMERIHDAI